MRSGNTVISLEFENVVFFMDVRPAHFGVKDFEPRGLLPV